MSRTSRLSPGSPLVGVLLAKIECSQRATTKRSTGEVVHWSVGQVLHYNAVTRSLEPWFWYALVEEILVLTIDWLPSNRPVYSDSGLGSARVEPSNLEEHRRHFDFQAPSCLCALLEGTEYTESRIRVVFEGERSGLYVAECAEGRCGYSGEPLSIEMRDKTTYSPPQFLSMISIWCSGFASGNIQVKVSRL